MELEEENKNLSAIILKMEKQLEIMIPPDTFKKVMEYFCECIEKKEVGGFRDLIYNKLSEKISYSEGVSLGIMDLNNALCDIFPDKKEA